MEAFETDILADHELEKKVANTILMRLRNKRQVVNQLEKEKAVSEYKRPHVVSRIKSFVRSFLFIK